MMDEKTEKNVHENHERHERKPRRLFGGARCRILAFDVSAFGKSKFLSFYFS
jgi:hypothetical protein